MLLCKLKKVGCLLVLVFLMQGSSVFAPCVGEYQKPEVLNEQDPHSNVEVNISSSSTSTKTIIPAIVIGRLW